MNLLILLTGNNTDFFYFFLRHPESAARYANKDGLKETLRDWIQAEKKKSSRDGRCF